MSGGWWAIGGFVLGAGAAYWYMDKKVEKAKDALEACIRAARLLKIKTPPVATPAGTNKAA